MRDIEACNLAISYLGCKPIISFDDPTKEARLCKAGFRPHLKAMLNDGTWTFARERMALPAAAQPPAFGFARKFLLPANVLRVLPPDPSVDPDISTDYVREGGYLLSDEEAPLYVKCVVEVDNLAACSDLFASALAFRLAAAFAVPLTENRSLQRDMLELYAVELRKAKAADGHQGPPAGSNVPTATDARY